MSYAQFLIKNGVDVNKKINSNTPLIVASENGHIDVVATLLKAGADPKLVDDQGRSAYGKASKQGHKAVCAALASVLFVVCLLGLMLFVQSCLQFAAAHGDTKQVSDFLSQPKANINETLENGMTALLLALRNGHMPVVNTLLDQKADANLINQDGDTALAVAASKGMLPACGLLVFHKADPQIGNNPGLLCVALFVSDCVLAVFDAAQEGKADIVEFLLKVRVFSCDFSLNIVLAERR